MQTTSGSSAPRVTVRQDPADLDRWFFDFDPAAQGGKGGASVLLHQGLVSVDGLHKNVKMPSRSTGGLLAEGLQIAGILNPVCLEAHNVEPTTANALAAGSNGQGTRMGNMLEDAAAALGATVKKWETENIDNAWHLRIFLSYP